MRINLILVIGIVFFLTGCRQERKPIVNSVFIDSLINNYTVPSSITLNEKEILFWKNRIDPDDPGISNELKYAGQLATRFRLTGDINDIKSADSVLLKIDSVYNGNEPAVYLSLARNCITQHRFTDAEAYLKKARNLDIKDYDDAAMSFDVYFELGNFSGAERELKKIRSTNDYGYFFRKAKWEHYKGNLDSSIAAMQKAFEWSGSNEALQQAALSNMADLYLHAGELQKASDIYIQSIRLSTADLHSIIGLGWIALVHDKNDSFAASIFQFVKSKTKSPDVLLKLQQTAEEKNDSSLLKKYATEFETIVSESIYGNMYNKYLVDLYTGILNNPVKAELIALKEIESRPNPQTFAWYVWSLYSNNKKEEAYKMYERYVSGKPLEGLELYWMGKMMQGLNKGYNAKEFMKAAEKNKYDLSPSKIRDIQNSL